MIVGLVQKCRMKSAKLQPHKVKGEGILDAIKRIGQALHLKHGPLHKQRIGNGYDLLPHNCQTAHKNDYLLNNVSPVFSHKYWLRLTTKCCLRPLLRVQACLLGHEGTGVKVVHTHSISTTGTTQPPNLAFSDGMPCFIGVTGLSKSYLTHFCI